MANHKATKKDARQAEKRRVRNKYYGKTTRNAIRDLREIKDKKEASDKMPTTVAMIDKLAKKGIIHKNTAAHYYKHIGIYAYRKIVLLQFTKWEQTNLEKTEKLEQLRYLENGIKIKMI